MALSSLRSSGALHEGSEGGTRVRPMGRSRRSSQRDQRSVGRCSAAAERSSHASRTDRTSLVHFSDSLAGGGHPAERRSAPAPRELSAKEMELISQLAAAAHGPAAHDAAANTWPPKRPLVTTQL